MSFANCAKISIFDESNDLVIESMAGDITILNAPASPRTGSLFGFVDSLKSFLNQLNPLHLIMNYILKTIHSEIKNRFADK